MVLRKKEDAGFIFEENDKRKELLYFLINYPIIEIRFMVDGLNKNFRFKDKDKLRLSEHLDFIKNSLWIIYDFLHELIFLLKYEGVQLDKFLKNFSNFVGERKLLNYLLKFSKDNFDDSTSLQFWITRLVNQIRMIFSSLNSNLNFDIHEDVKYEIQFSIYKD